MKLDIIFYLFLFKYYLSSVYSQETTGDEYRNVAYYVNWAIYERQFFPQELPISNLTHVLYAFANINPESGAVYLSDLWADINAPLLDVSSNSSEANLYGCLQQMYILKKQNRNLKVLLSIGGSTYSANFPVAVSTISKRATFASSVVSLIQNLGLDGVDIDWEYPADDTQANNFVLLLQQIKGALDAYSGLLKSPYHFLLTVAGPANANTSQNWKLSEMDQYVDFWNFMAFDYSGPWSSVTAHQANLSPSGNGSTPFDTKTGVSYYIAHGVASNKIVLGMPIYGRSFEQTDGLGKGFEGIGPGTWASGVYDYKAMPLPGAVEVYDEAIGASYSWDSSKKEIVSYDNPMVALQKGKWIQSMNLGGAMWWETSADALGSRSLIGSIMGIFDGHIQNVTNQLSFPNSSYLNIRNGMPGYSQLPLSVDTSPTMETPSSGITTLPGSSSSGDTLSETASHILSCSLGNIVVESTALFTAITTTSISSSPADTKATFLSVPLESIATPAETATSHKTISSTATMTSITTVFMNTFQGTAPSAGTGYPLSNYPSGSAMGSTPPFANRSQISTTAFQSLSSESGCSFASGCSIFTTTYSFSTPTIIIAATTTSVSFPVSSHSAVICACKNCYFGVKYATSGAATTTLCGNVISMPTGYTILSKGTTTVFTTAITTTRPETTIATPTAAKQNSACSPKLVCNPSSTNVAGPNYSPTGTMCAMDTKNDLVCVKNALCTSLQSCTTNGDCAEGEVCVSVCCQRACFMDDSKCMSLHCVKVATGCLGSD